MRKKPLCLMFVLIFILLHLASRTSAQQITNGLNYLTTVQKPDGSWGNDISITEILPVTIEVVATLRVLNQTSTQSYANAISWLQNQSLDTTDYLSERIYALSVAGPDKDILLSYLDELLIAWGGYDEYGVNNLDTSLALSALKRINYSDQNITSHGLGYLLSTQNSDGGWGFYLEDESNVYMTALVLNMLSQYKSIYNLQTQINNGVTYLLSKQNPDGGFGKSPSTVYETALAFLALVESGTDISSVASQSINYLASTQLPNGSWNDDPYSTALALRALANVKPNLSIAPLDITFSNPNPKVGDTITITATIYNEGPTNADNVVVQFYDGDPSSGGTLIGETTIPSIPAYGSSQVSVPWTIPTASARKVFVKVDPLNSIDELSETDNVASKNLTSATLPDLSITPADITFTPPAPMPGEAVTIAATVRNNGETSAENVLVEIYEGDPSSGGTKLGETTFPVISAGGSGAAQLTNSFPLGSHSIFVVTDSANIIVEGDEGNNSAMKALQVGGGFIDLSITGNDISFSPASPIAGNLVLINATIHNIGDTQAENVPVRLYLGNPASGGTQIGSEITIPLISAQSSFSVSTTWDSTGHPGNNDIYVSIDPNNSINEPYRQNNIVFKTIAVGTSSGPDLTITSPDITFSPQAPLEGEFVIIAANIKNNGTADAERVFVECSITDPADGSSFVIGSHIIPLLPAEGTSAVQMTLLTQGLSGTYEIYFNVDPSNTIIETNETNNIAHKSITVTSPPGPDLITSSVDISGVSSNPQTLTIIGNVLAVIKNRGNQETASPFVLTAFEDRNKNYAYDPEVDNVVGETPYSNNLAAKGTDTVIIPVSGTILFLDSPIYLFIDSGNVITEKDETNNISCIPIFTACRNSKVDKAIKEGASWLIDHQLNVDEQGTMKGWAADDPLLYNAVAINAYKETGKTTGTKYENVFNKLIQMQAPNGSWDNYLRATANAILSLKDIGISPDEVVIQNAVQWIIRQQNSDGGWGLTKGSESQAYDTGLAMMALLKMGANKNEPFILNGVQWLTLAQNSNGYWGAVQGLGSNPDIDTYPIIGLALATSTSDPRVIKAKNWYYNYRTSADQRRVFWLRMILEVEPNHPDIINVATGLLNLQRPDNGWRYSSNYDFSEFKMTADTLYLLGRLGFAGTKIDNGILWVERHISSLNEGFPEQKNVTTTDVVLDALQAARIDDSANQNAILLGRKAILSAQNPNGSWGYHFPDSLSDGKRYPYATGESIFAFKYYDDDLTPQEQSAANRGINFLVSTQSSDGGWASTPGYTIGSYFPSGLRALMGLLQSGLTSSHTTVSKGLSYLISQKNPDGGYGNSDQTARAAIIYKLAGSSYQSHLEQAASWLRANQNQDGGWGPMLGYTSNTSDTSIVLIALSFAGETDIEIAKGVFWLLAAQNQDRGWGELIGIPVNKSYTTGLSVWALSLARFTLAVDLDASVERQNYCPNDMVKVTVTTEQPPEDITLEGSVSYQGGGSYPLTFNLVAGVFEAGFNIPDGTLPGTGTVQVTGRATYGYGVDVTSFNIRNCSLMKPDLAITDADLKESVEDPGNPDLRTISATIKNLGEADANNVVAHFYRGSPAPENLIDSKTIPNISVFGSSTITLSYTLSEDVLITVVVDPDNAIEETLENNNLAAIQLTRSIPDLSISPSDVTILPPNTIEGQSAVITAIIHNIGNLGASNINVSFYDGDPQDGGTPIGAKAVSAIDSGATVFVEMPWDTFGQSGRNYLHVVIDPYNAIGESNENNNSTLVPVDVTPPTKPDLAITSSDIAFSSANPKEGELLTINVTIHNLGTETGNVEASLYNGDPSGAGIFLDKKTYMPVIPFGGRVTLSFIVNTIGFSGNQNFFAQVDPDNRIDEMLESNNLASNSITIAQAGLSLGVSTDKSAYTANEDVQITVNLNNHINSDRLGTLEVKILDGNNNLVAAVSTQALTLGPNEVRALTDIWNTGKTLSGGYKVACQFSEGGIVISRTEALITIAPVKEISSSVFPDKISYLSNRPVTITSTVQSASPNYIFSGLVARITLLNGQGTTLFLDTKTIPFLTLGQRVELKTYWNTALNPRGTYTVRLEVLEGISVLGTSTATFEILGSSQTSEGILGTITAQPKLLYQGKNEILSYSVTNKGNEDISGLTVKVLIVNPDTQEVKNTLESSLSLPMGTTSTGNFIVSTSNLPPRTYLAILQVYSPTMTQPKTIASAVFMVIQAVTLPFSDNFDSYAVGASAPAPWFELCEGQAVITGAESYSGQNSIMTGGGLGNSHCALVGLGETYPDRISYEVRAKVNLAGSSAFIGFFEEIVNMVPQFNAVYFNGADGKVYFYSADKDHGFLVPLLDSFAVGVWYKVRVEIDFSILTADVYIDDVLVDQGLPVSPKEAVWEYNGTYNFQLNKIGVLHYLGEPFYFDDFSVFERRNHPPIADAGLNMAIFGNMQYSTVIQGMASDPDNDPMSYRWLEGQNELIPWRPVGPNGECYLELGSVPAFTLGEHILSLEVDDGNDISGDDMILTVNNSAPHPAPAGGGVCEINTQFPLKGQISDYDGDIVNYGWIEADQLLFGGSIQTLYGGTPVNLPEYLYQCSVLGEHTVSLSANDGVNQTVNAQIHISVTDTSMPILAPAPDKNILWPPNHKMVTVIIQANARDNSGGPVLLSAVVSSNEPQNGLGDGDVSPDWTEPVIDQVNGVITLQLRAERSGSGNGRVYSIRITATDTSGNSSYGDVNIIVPHDQGN